MSTGLVLPGQSRPSNLILGDASKVSVIESDVYDICNRIREEVPDGDRLYIILHEGQQKPFTVMERADDGRDMMVLKAEALDARIIKKLQHMVGVPFEKRLEALETAEQAAKDEQHARELDELYETMGRPMLTQLEHDGFIDTRPVSYSKLPKARRKRPKGL